MADRTLTTKQRAWLIAPRRRRLIVVAGVWLVALAGAFFVVLPDSSRLLALSSSTVEVQATVVSHTDPSAMINRRSATAINYRYERDGRTYTGGFNTIDEEELRRYRPGASIPVLVATSDPGASRYVEAQGGGMALIVELLIVLLVALGPLAYLLVEGARHLRTSWLLRRGALTEAKVLGRFRGNTLDEGPGTGQGKLSIVRYLFEVDGREYQGSVIGGTRKRMKEMVPHETFSVAYDPKDPSRSCWFAAERPAT